MFILLFLIQSTDYTDYTNFGIYSAISADWYMSGGLIMNEHTSSFFHSNFGVYPAQQIGYQKIS
jgi:hypothetical protein